MYNIGFKIWNKELFYGVNAPIPSVGNFIPLSWNGAKVPKYIFSAPPPTVPYTYNTIVRDINIQSFDMAIFSDQTLDSNSNFILSGDSINQSAGTNFFVGIGLQSNVGINYVDLEFSFFANGTNITWYESGVFGGVVATTILNEMFAYRLEYTGSSNTLKLFINDTLVHTATTNYVNDTLVIKLLGRNTNTIVANHLALKTSPQPNKILAPLGDSITNGTIAPFSNGSYIERTLAFVNNTFYANPVYAISGSQSADVISIQLPLAVSNFDATKTSSVATLMIGINDLNFFVPVATIQANITTIVTTLQSVGYIVVLQTVLPDFGTVIPDRLVLNTWIKANSVGADHVVDYTNTDLEVNSALFESDLVHPNVAGNNVIANKLWLLINTL